MILSFGKRGVTDEITQPKKTGAVMPKLTNRLGLVEALVNAAQNDPYSKGDADISVTTLLKPMQAVVLEDAFADQITEDVAERVWSLYGQIVHTILERANRSDDIVTERRLFMEIDGVRISGSMDSFEVSGGVCRDFKFTTAYKFKNGLVDPEWEKQQNAYAQLLRANNFPVSKLEIVGLLRDHSKLEARRDAAYPQLPVSLMPIPLWPEEKTMAFLRGRVAEYKANKKAFAENRPLTPCTPEERWARPDVYAVMKEGRKTAVRLHDDAMSAQRHASELGANHSVVKRPGESVRCENYCAVKDFCPQYKRMKGEE